MKCPDLQCDYSRFHNLAVQSLGVVWIVFGVRHKLDGWTSLALGSSMTAHLSFWVLLLTCAMLVSDISGCEMVTGRSAGVWCWHVKTLRGFLGWVWLRHKLGKLQCLTCQRACVLLRSGQRVGKHRAPPEYPRPGSGNPLPSLANVFSQGSQKTGHSVLCCRKYKNSELHCICKTLGFSLAVTCAFSVMLFAATPVQFLCSTSLDNNLKK